MRAPDHDRRQPAGLDPRLGERWRRRSSRSTSWSRVDIYVNETTRHADVILPAPEPLAKAHYDAALYQLAIRSVANYSAPVLDAPEGQPHEWEVILRLAAIAAGQGPDADIEAWDELVIQTLIGREVALPGSPDRGPRPGRDRGGARRAPRPRADLDFMLRVGPFGEGFGADPEGLTLERLEANPHGIDLGPMRPRLPDVLRTPSGRIELAPPEIVADVPRLRGRAAADGIGRNGEMVLIGRRQLRSNNSWMHNLPALVKGKDRCTVQVHPDDAERLGLADGGRARVTSAAASSSRRSRSPTRSCPAWSRSRTAGATTLPATGWRSPPSTPASTRTCWRRSTSTCPPATRSSTGSRSRSPRPTASRRRSPRPLRRR